MRINHNINSMITQNSLSSAGANVGKSLEKLSTGLRINRSSDDAAGLSVSEQLRSQVRGLGRARSNAQDGIALLQIAEGAANETSDILQRMRELAVQSSNDTLTSTDRSYLDQEFTALTNEIDRIAESTQYNGQKLITGGSDSFGGVGATASVVHIGANATAGIDNIAISIDSITAGAIGVTAGVGVSDQASSLAAIDTLDSAITSVNNMRSDMGAYVNRLEHAINNLSNQEFNTQDAESRIRDVDFATETTKFTKNQILSQSATSMLSQANAVPQGALGLL
jgi:flagellin